MPCYEYICQDCGFEFEEIQKFSDPPIYICPKCKNETVVKKISLTSFSLKGQGWYKDGYGADKVKNQNSKVKSQKDQQTSEKKSDVKKTKACSESGRSEKKNI